VQRLCCVARLRGTYRPGPPQHIGDEPVHHPQPVVDAQPGGPVKKVVVVVPALQRGQQRQPGQWGSGLRRLADAAGQRQRLIG